MEVSEVGYGAWGIGGSKWLGAEDENRCARCTRRSISA
jgi:aryl-alcohol dehydrogenase-like predicted oxidoreductase